MKNWSGLLEWNPQEIAYPASEEEIVNVIKRAADSGLRIRTIGSGHSFTPLCQTEEILLSLDKHQGIIAVDPETKIVRVKAGTKIRALNEALAAVGLALENMGDIDVQSIAGAISTGTHGTGIQFGNLCTQIVALRFVNGVGELVACSRSEHPDLFRAAVLSLGALGVLTEVSLRCVPAYNLELKVEKRKLEAVRNTFLEINKQNRHFEFYWFPNTAYVMTKELNISNQPVNKDSTAEYLQEMLLENYAFKLVCELSCKIPSLTNRLSGIAAATISEFKKCKPSHRVFSTQRIVRFNEMEYNVPIEAYAEVSREIERWVAKHNRKIVFPLENRFVKGDDLYLSPAYQRDSAYIAVHAYHKKDHKAYFAGLEDIFRAYNGRPHWGKMHTQSQEELQQRYPEFETFQRIRETHDPQGLFMNPYLQSLFGKS